MKRTRTKPGSLTGGLSWKLLLGCSALVAIAVLGSAWLILTEAARVRNEELEGILLTEARLLAHALLEPTQAADAERIELLIDRLRSEESEVVAIARDGRVLADRAASLNLPRNILELREVSRVLHGGQSTTSILVSPTGHRMRTVVVRIGDMERPIGAVVVARPLWTFAAHGIALRTLIIELVLVLLLTLALLAFGVARLWSRPLYEVIRTARSLSRGDLSARADTAATDELGLLARALNRMRDRLFRNYQTIDRQRAVLESLLSQLREGVVVADADGRIALINPAALRLLNIPAQEDGTFVVGEAVERCIPEHDLQQLLLPDQPLPRRRSETESDEAHLHEARLQIDRPEGTVHLLVHASNLMLPEAEPASAEPRIGRLVVLTDITTLAQTIQMKTDFVANASHELRTPLSTIRAAIETLQNMNLAEDPAAAQRFLQAIDRQSGRLEALVSDLLDLARLEAPGARFEPSTVVVRELLADVEQHFADRFEARKLRWLTDTSACSSPTLRANPHLLRLVIDNLVDNAIKFTDPGGWIRVTCRNGDGQFIIDVTDNGCGIPQEDQNRVFERFYQVERARSGHERGTGLGLSIVRHALAAMDGEVRLASELGCGTTVTIVVPQSAGGAEEDAWST